MIYALILAGGRGERFWPLSSENNPKQFHCLYSKSTSFQETIARIKGLIPADNIYVSANKQHRVILEKQLKQFAIPTKNIFFEASPKSTLAPVSFLSAAILSKDKNAVIVVLPSDHFIDDRKKFIKIIKKALNLAKKGYIVCLGKRPDHPETGFGYIKLGKKLLANPLAYEAEKFIEKPKKQVARRFVKMRQYLWNCGIFIFKAETLKEELKRYAKALYRNLKYADNKAGIAKIWHRLPSVSIDYGIMEKTRNAAVVCINHKWSDLGSWKSFGEIFKKDKFNNFFKGKVIDIGSKNTTVLTCDRQVATLGLNNIIIVNTKDALLVCAKDYAQDVKRIVSKLKSERIK